MSSIDDDLFGPIDGAGGSAPPVVDQSDQSDQIEALYRLLSSMPKGEEVTLNFDRPDGSVSFQLRLLGKIVP